MANQYGWTKDYILNKVYPDEAQVLSGIINKRIFADYLVQLAIVENPWRKEPEKLVKELQKRVGEEELGKEKLDKEGMKRLKNLLARKSRNIGVK